MTGDNGAKDNGAKDDGAKDDGDATLLTRRTLGVLTAALTLAFGAAIALGAREFSIGWSDRGPEPGYFPFWIGIVIAAGSLATLRQAVANRSPDGRSPAITHSQARRVATFLLPMIAFVALAHAAGIYAATVAYLFGVMVWQGGYSIAAATAVGVGTTVALYLLFDVWLKVPLAKGPIEAWLGLH